jgi:hypothetical protein
MKTYTTKLIELIERDKLDIARQWYDYVIKNPRTKSIYDYANHEMITTATKIYDSFRELFFSVNLTETVKEVFGSYAEELYKKEVPPHEAIYALILMRRHIWLYSGFKSLFGSLLEHHQREETLNRTMLIFDYAFYTIIEKYEELRNRGK